MYRIYFLIIFCSFVVSFCVICSPLVPEISLRCSLYFSEYFILSFYFLYALLLRYSLQLFLAFASTSHGAHEPELGVVSFVRSSVEKIPDDVAEFNGKLAYSERPSFGETFLPLRSAVESAPSYSL